MIERAPPKLRTTPGSNIIRPVAVRARRVCSDCDLESRLGSIEQCEHIWLQRFVMELNKREEESVSEGNIHFICCSRKRTLRFCDRCNVAQHDRPDLKGVTKNYMHWRKVETNFPKYGLARDTVYVQIQWATQYSTVPVYAIVHNFATILGQNRKHGNRAAVLTKWLP